MLLLFAEEKYSSYNFYDSSLILIIWSYLKHIVRIKPTRKQPDKYF